MVRSTVAHLSSMLRVETLWVNPSHHDPITNEDEYEATKYDSVVTRLIHCICSSARVYINPFSREGS